MSDHQKRGSTDDNSPQSTQSRPDKNNIPTESENDGQNPPSLATRIQNSASGLARNVFLPSIPSGDVAQLLSDSSKAAPSASSSALAAAEKYRESPGASSSSPSSRDQSAYRPSESFRSSSTALQGGFELPELTQEEFQSAYGGDISDEVTTISKGKGKGREPSLEYQFAGDANENTPSQPEFFETITTTTTTTLPSDGDAVVSLLSDKNFDTELPPSADEPFEPIDTELSLPQLTPAEIQIIESFRRQLPPPEQIATQSASRQLTSLNLVPDIGAFLDTVPVSSVGNSHATALRDTVLTSLPGAAEWISVEEKYHDEVWGYLQPTLEAAAREIDSKKDGPGREGEEGPAIRRLKMILKHMQH